MRISRFPSIVDDVNVRLIAGGVLVVSALALATGQWWLYAVLAAEFVLRAGWGPSASPLARGIQRFVRPRVAAAPRYTAGPPKRFAATIGAVMTGAAAILGLVATLTGSSAAGTAVLVIGVVMVLFPALEAFFGFCVGCVLFGLLMRTGLVPEEICLDCADLTRRSSSTGAQAGASA
ncbi:DUF4395 domain-containing protein [Knoellia sp. p5-6-4]|uniref:DUF4395 domain-containing protein n=1 Tax=unclassified Knoellia TaxID=2618719 RepID=UPI0023DC1F21|nr:DUF4395 domain-containing protein [Knoellia sp. p5-6-4]MDF2146192.1 DUF4395 domain-containing protein [Knoellia sp. p5-6-4]